MEKIQMTLTVSADMAMKIAEILAGENKQLIPAAPVQQPALANAVPVQQSTPTVPVQQPIPVQQTAPAINSTPIQFAPVAQPCTYTVEQIQTACAPLMDAGKQQELVNLLAQFGVQSLPQLPKEQFGAFATALRGLGAKI